MAARINRKSIQLRINDHEGAKLDYLVGATGKTKSELYRDWIEENYQKVKKKQEVKNGC